MRVVLLSFEVSCVYIEGSEEEGGKWGEPVQKQFFQAGRIARTRVQRRVVSPSKYDKLKGLSAGTISDRHTTIRERGRGEREEGNFDGRYIRERY